MPSKLFYQRAVDEVSNGTIDQALWIKVVADMPSADKVTQQAKYIQLRAKELSYESATTTAAGFVPVLVRLLKWGVTICVVGILLFVAGFALITRLDDMQMQKNAIGFGATVQAHVASRGPESDAYRDQVMDMNRTCAYWENGRQTDSWMKGADAEAATAIAACDQVAAELKRVQLRP